MSEGRICRVSVSGGVVGPLVTEGNGRLSGRIMAARLSAAVGNRVLV